MKRKTASRLGIMLAASVALTGVADAQLKAIRTQTAITPASASRATRRIRSFCRNSAAPMPGRRPPM